MERRDIMRRRLLESMYDKMTEEEKRMFVILTLQDRNHREIMEALESQRKKLSEVEKKQGGWSVDFLSDVGANILTDSLIALSRLLLRKR